MNVLVVTLCVLLHQILHVSSVSDTLTIKQVNNADSSIWPVEGVATYEYSGCCPTTFDFQCLSSNNSLNLSWRKGSESVTQHLITGGIMFSLPTLSSASGIYTCTASDSVNHIIYDSVSINITGANPAAIAKDETLEAAVGDTVNIQFYASSLDFVNSYPSASSISWQFNGEVLTHGHHSNDKRSLVISNVQASHAGTYKFVVEYTDDMQVIRQATAVTLLIVKGPPTGLGYTITSTTVMLHWVAPDLAAGITNYDVQIISNNVSHTTMTTDGNITQLNVSSLSRGPSEYQYRVSAKFSNNMRLYSAYSQPFTLDVPEPVSSVMASINISDTGFQIVVEWEPPPSSSRPPVLNYKVRHNISDTVNTSSDTSIMLSGALPGETYSITVQAVNVLGDGESSSTSVSIPEPVLSSPISTATKIYATSSMDTSYTSTTATTSIAEPTSLCVHTTIVTTYLVTTMPTVTATVTVAGLSSSSWSATTTIVASILGAITLVFSVIVVVVVVVTVFLVKHIHKTTSTQDLPTPCNIYDK